MLAKRRRKQFGDETAETFHLHPIVEHEEKNAERHAERTVKVSRRQRTEMRKADPASHHREQVNRDQVDGVHQRHPAEHGQSKRSNEGAIAMHDVLGLVIDHFHQHFDGALHLAGDPGSCLLSTGSQNEKRDNQHQHGEEEGVVVHYGKINNGTLLHRSEMRHMMLNILSSGKGFCCHGYRSLVFLEQHDEVAIRHRNYREDKCGPMKVFVVPDSQTQKSHNHQDLDDFPGNHGVRTMSVRCHEFRQRQIKRQKR